MDLIYLLVKWYIRTSFCLLPFFRTALWEEGGERGMPGLTRLAFEIEKEHCGCHDGRLGLICRIFCGRGFELRVEEGKKMRSGEWRVEGGLQKVMIGCYR